MKRIITTMNDTAGARIMAHGLIERRLVSCAHISPLRSIYRWKGVMHEEEEVMLSVLTTESLADEVRTFIEKEHPYEVPVIETMDVDLFGEAVSWAIHGTGSTDAQS